jgi:hypothetical protein
MIDDNPAEKISLRPKSAMERGRRQKIQPSRRYREYTASRAARRALLPRPTPFAGQLLCGQQTAPWRAGAYPIYSHFGY